MPVPGAPTGVRVPTPGTLKRYGLTRDDWVNLMILQRGVCGVCGKVPPAGYLCIDHEHFPGWRKAWKRLPAAERKRYVRGLLCSWCNGKLVGWRLTLEKAVNTVTYLRRYERRRPKPKPKGEK